MLKNLFLGLEGGKGAGSPNSVGSSGGSGVVGFGTTINETGEGYCKPGWKHQSPVLGDNKSR